MVSFYINKNASFAVHHIIASCLFWVISIHLRFVVQARSGSFLIFFCVVINTFKKTQNFLSGDSWLSLIQLSFIAAGWLRELIDLFHKVHWDSHHLLEGCLDHFSLLSFEITLSTAWVMGRQTREVWLKILDKKPVCLRGGYLHWCCGSC